MSHRLAAIDSMVRDLFRVPFEAPWKATSAERSGELSGRLASSTRNLSVQLRNSLKLSNCFAGRRNSIPVISGPVSKARWKKAGVELPESWRAVRSISNSGVLHEECALYQLVSPFPSRRRPQLGTLHSQGVDR